MEIHHACRELRDLPLTDLAYRGLLTGKYLPENKGEEDARLSTDMRKEFGQSEEAGLATVREVVAVAKEIGVSPSSFCQLYKRRFHMSPVQSSIHWRLVHATRLLEETSLSTKEISNLLGYHSLHLFGRQFVKKYNLTPKQYRASKTFKQEIFKDKESPKMGTHT